MSDEWITNEHGISIQNREDFEAWNWLPIDPATALLCMDIVNDAIKENAMACITMERGFPEINFGLFEFEYQCVFRLVPLVENWIGYQVNYTTNVLSEEDLLDARKLLVELEDAAAIVRQAIAASVIS